MADKDFNKYLTILGGIIIGIGVLFVGYGFISPEVTKKQVPLQTQSVAISWKVLELPQLSNLRQFSEITLSEQNLGRDDPFVEMVKQETE